MGTPAIVTWRTFVAFIFESAGSGSVSFGTEGTDPRFSAQVCRMMEFQTSTELGDGFGFSIGLHLYVESGKRFKIKF